MLNGMMPEEALMKPNGCANSSRCRLGIIVAGSNSHGGGNHGRVSQCRYRVRSSWGPSSNRTITTAKP
jgi:hypothetical protein